MTKAQIAATLGALRSAKDAIIAAAEKCEIPHYRILLKGQLKPLNDGIEKLTAALDGKFIKP